jgi:inosine-uridine nucleoside N-ribohydrolase
MGRLRTRILFDTDPGIDDALALLMLARDARAELVGISTVFGNASVDTTTANALALCHRFGLQVPVARGADQPLQRPPRPFPTQIHGHDGLGDVAPHPAHGRVTETGAAAQFICDMARRHPGEVTLLAVGPLTNLALALALDPELPGLVPRVVVMGGAFGTRGHGGNVTPLAEANVYCDPHAADAVFGAPWPVTVVGLDVTHQVLMSTAYLDALGDEGGADGRYLRDITRPYERFYRQRTGGGIFAHDASAVACALAPQRFEVRQGALRVVTDGLALGQTLQSQRGHHPAAQDWNGLPEQQACIAVDADGVLADFRGCVVR